MKMRKLLSFVLALLLVLALPRTALAASYPDLEGHWARTYMEDLAKRGYLAGYDDGNMWPDEEITAAMAFTLLARIFTVGDLASELVDADYGELIADAVKDSSWAYDGIATCLAAGVLTETEFEALAASMSEPLEKEYLAVLFVRTMGLADYAESLDIYTLKFYDTASITAAYRPYVYVLTEAGIISGSGENKFEPKSNVTRAVAATMLSIALTYMEDHKISPVLARYENLTQSEAIVTEVGDGYAYLRDFSGVERLYLLPGDVLVTENGKEATLSTAAHTGCYASVIYDAKALEINRLRLETGSKTRWVQGVIKQVKNTSSQLIVTDPTDFTDTAYDIDTDAVITSGGSAVAMNKLTTGDFVTMKLVSGSATEVAANACAYTLEGTLEAVRYGAIIRMTVADEQGDTLRFYVSLSNMPVIKRGGVTVSIDKLKTGDTLTVTVKKGQVSAVTADAQSTNVSGTITAITLTSTGKILVLEGGDGVVTTYLIAENANIWEDKTALTFSDLSVGDTISAVAESGVLTDIYLETRVTNAEEASGEILSTDTSAREFILYNGNALIYVTVPESALIVSVGGSTLSFSKLSVGNYVTVYGSYTSGTSFKAATVLVK